MQTTLSRCVPRRILRRTYHELSYLHHGEPFDVLEYHAAPSDVIPNFPSENHHLSQVEMIHVPWNPADVNTVQGKYGSPYGSNGVSPPSTLSQYFSGRSVAGSEGWGRVVASTTLPIGSLVTVGTPGLGTLRSSICVSSDYVLNVPPKVLEQLGPAGSTLFQLGGTALRLLTDFVSLQPGDVVLQNAGNSGVGVMVSQLAMAMFDAPTVSMVRRGSKTSQEMDEMIDYLLSTGKNAMVVVEEDLDNSDYRKQVQSQLMKLSVSGQMPQLALNSVGGESAKSLLRLLDTGGTMVTYGGMSGQPVTVGTPQLIFKDLRVLGYWHSRWMVNNTVPTKQGLVDALVKAVTQKSVSCPPCTVFPMSDVKEALKWHSSQTGGIRSKLVFDCQT